MEESEDNMSIEEMQVDRVTIKTKPKKRSLVERELETSLTARVTSPLTNGDVTRTSRYGRARRIKCDTEISDSLKNLQKLHPVPKPDKSPSKVQSPAYKMHASISPVRMETPKKDSLENQIVNIYNENISLSRFSSDETACTAASNKSAKVYIRKDLIQSKEKDDDTIVLIKNIFSPSKIAKKPDSHITNYLDRSSEQYHMNKPISGNLNTSSVVKTLDFDSKKKKREEKKPVLSKSELFDMEAQCIYQVGDLVWARMGTYPFWPCIITRDPFSGMFVKKKLYGCMERDMIHVTFFGDNGRRSWIIVSMFRKFLGQVEFEAAKTNFRPEVKKKDPRLFAAFFVSEKKMPQWLVSVGEAELLLKEPKRLRIDILNDMLLKCGKIKTTPKLENSRKVVRTDSDVSLSESLLDTLFSEDDSKGNDIERSRSKNGNRTLDVSEVVTACLDNMAAKTGITKIQRQSHMDRWLQKAKSKTPEKSNLKSHLSLKIEKNTKLCNAKHKTKPYKIPGNKSYNFRKTDTESQYETANKLWSHQNEHDYSIRCRENNVPIILDDVEIEYENAEMLTSDVIEPGSGLGIISKVETLCGNAQSENNENHITMTVVNNDYVIKSTNHDYVKNNYAPTLNIENEINLEKDNITPISANESKIMESNKIKSVKLQISESDEATYTAQDENNSKTLCSHDSFNENVVNSKEVLCNVSEQHIVEDKSIHICESTQTTKNLLHENNLITINMSMDTTKKTETDLNNLKNNVQYKSVIKKQEFDPEKGFLKEKMSQNEELESNKFTKNDTLRNAEDAIEDCTLHATTVLDKNNLDQTSIRLIENAHQNKTIELDSGIGNSTSLYTLSIAEDGIVDLSDLPTSIETREHVALSKENSLQNLEHNQELTISNKNSKNNIITQSTIATNANYNEYDGDGIEDFDEVSKNTVEEKSTELITVSNDFNSPEFDKDRIGDFPDVSTENGKQNQAETHCSISVSKTDKRQNDLKEFETQLYNIFGLSNKKSPKGKLNLSINKSCKNTHLTEKVKIWNNGIPFDKKTESTYKTKQKNKDKISSESINKNVLVSDMEVGLEHKAALENESEKYVSDKIETSERRNSVVNKIQDPIFETLQTKQLNNAGIISEENKCNDDKVTSTIDKYDVGSNFIDNESSATIQLNSNCPIVETVSEINTARKIKVTNDDIIDKSNSDDITKKKTLNYEDDMSSSRQNNLPSINKLSNDTVEALKDPKFLEYLELKQDALIDEQSELSEVEIKNYLYKTWLYEENLKNDLKKNDDVLNTKLVNGLKQSPIKIKLSLNKLSKNNKKTYKVEITNDDDDENYQKPVNIFEKKQKKNASNSKTEPSPKRSRRINRNNHIGTRFEKYFFSSVKKDRHCNNILELTPKEVVDKQNDTCQIEMQVKADEKDDSNKDFATGSSVSPVESDNTNDQNRKKILSSDKIDNIENPSSKISEDIMQNACSQEDELKPRLNQDCFDAVKNSVHNDRQINVILTKHTYVENEEINEEIVKEKCEIDKGDADNTSVTSEDSDISITNKKTDTHKLANHSKEKLKNPDFLKYVELKQDTVIDEHPQLTEEEITNYLYKTWLYEESLKNDIKKVDDIETVTNLVKGLNQDAAPIKRVRKKKVDKDRHIIDSNQDSAVITCKEKSKRKIIKPYFYREHFSDIEDDIEFFDILTPQTSAAINESGELTEIQPSADEIDAVEEYFRQLTAPKPNLFKGLLREKVCEICEKSVNLLKCKGCQAMFHVDCVNKKTEIAEVATAVRGRKKKKKTRGRKPKDHTNSLDSECASDDKSQDPNASDETQNTSFEYETEPYVIPNADDFEAQLSAKMKQLLENTENNKEYEFLLNTDEVDWNDINYGECKIVDVMPWRREHADVDHSDFKCGNCQKYTTPVCFVCKCAVSPKCAAEHRQRCQVAHCNRYYHLECLDHWPQTQFNAGELSRINNGKQLVEALTCPRHVCHTCVCDDPRGCKTRFSGDKLARCVRCPATYHTFTKCLPAGTQILSASHIICPRHYEHRPGKVPCHVNTGWCFICALGGTLICCEYCPTSFHAECLNIDPPEGGYMCEDCETGRLPLYGEMVWVKLGHYRWWPGIILHPSEIPRNILAVKHSQGEFVVRFFGQYDYYWVNRGRVFPFQEGDSGKVSSQRSKIDAAFTMAMEHAQRACEILKTASPNEEECIDIASSLLPPHYVKLKVNKPCGSLCGKKIDIEESSLTQCECDPKEFDPCGPYTQCLNRMLLTECGPTCRAGDQCNNRAFEKRLYPKMTPYRTPHRGWGLKALEDIKAGQFVIEYVGELIDEEEFKRRMRRKQEVRDENFYYLTLDKERMIDAGPKGNLARFMNHSCEPNCETQKWTVLGDVRVGLFALNDIPANSELTFNYNLESTGIEKKQCMCGAKRCSGYIGEKPKQDEQPKRTKQTPLPAKRAYKKRKITETSPSCKPKQRVGRPHRPKELTEIEKDLLIIKNATSGMSSDSESSRLSVDSKDSKGLKRRRGTEDNLSPSTKRFKADKQVDQIQGADAN